MKLRTLVITVALLGALSIATFLRNRPESAPSADPRVGTPVLGAETAARAAALVVSDQGKKVELVRGADGTWRVSSYFDLPADFEKISRLVQDLNEAKVERFVTSNPDRLARLEFKDSQISVRDAQGKEIWSVVFGKTPESGNGRFIRFGEEPKAFFSGLHVWLDTDAKGWANAQLVDVKPDDVAKIEIPFAGGSSVGLVRAKKDAPWDCPNTPAGKKLSPEKASSVLGTLTGIRFSDTADPKDSSAREAAEFMRTFSLTTFDGRILHIALGRKPEEKKLRPPAADSKETLASLADLAPGKTGVKAITPEYDTVPAGPVFASVSSSVADAPVNGLMKRRAFKVDEYVFTGLPQSAEEMFEPAKVK